jgi:hypothetical protein
LHRRRILAIASIRARRRVALTAPAVFDGYRVGLDSSSERPSAMPSKLAADGANATGLKRMIT